MVLAILAILGLILGSFVSALNWRLHEHSKGRNDKQLSIWTGRSMCPNCKHTLGVIDLVPLFSWLVFRSKCRYCSRPISIEYPLLEAVTALLFVGSYIFWPVGLMGALSIAIFVLWLAQLVVLVALAAYDLKWRLLPNKLVLALAVLAVAQAVIVVATADRPLASVISHLAGVVIGGGLFYLIFQFSRGKWIGGGDVKLGTVLGLITASPSQAILLLFLASLIGTLVSLPLLLIRKLGRKSAVPFGPFLILATILVVLFGKQIIDWYVSLFTLG